MKLNSGYETRRARIEMLPLIDVVFLLLVFFIYAMLSMVLHRGVAVTLPAADTAVVDDRDYISISIDHDDRLYVNRQEVTLEEVARAVQQHRGAEDMPVYIEGDSAASLGVAIQVLDRLRAAGIPEVSFATKETAP